MADNRGIQEGTRKQGADEALYWPIITTPWGSSPSSVSVKAYSRSGAAEWTDVTATVRSGAATVDGDTITCPKLSGLTEGTLYRLEIQFTSGGNIFEPYILVQAER